MRMYTELVDRRFNVWLPVRQASTLHIIQQFVSLCCNYLPYCRHSYRRRSQMSKLLRNYPVTSVSERYLSYLSTKRDIQRFEPAFSQIFHLALHMQSAWHANGCSLKSGSHMRSFIRAWMSVCGVSSVHQGAFTCAAKRLYICRLFLFECLLDIITLS